MMRGLAASLLLVSCAGVGGVTERSFSRDELRDLELRNIDVVVVAKGPPLAAGPLLEVQPFEAPRRTTVLSVEEQDSAMRDALATALQKDLAARGFSVSFIGAQPEIAPLPPIETSTAIATSTTVATSTTIGLAPANEPGAPRTASRLASDTTLEDLRLASTADALLVIRAVIVDQFHLHEPAKTIPNAPGDTTPVRQEPGRAYAVNGRLLIGQAFLFDRKTGVRLWSRQLPDYPEGGKILENHPILAYGFVQKDRRALEPETKARLAAGPFVAAMLGEFPVAQRGKPEARAALDRIDVEKELREEQFFDDSRLMLEAELSYSGERSGTELVLDGQALPPLGTGAISPNGIVRAGLRLGYLTPGGIVLSLAGQFGGAPGSFARTYHRDRLETDMGDRDRNARVTITGANTFAGELGLGYLVLLSESLMLLPGADLFLDVWRVDAEPAGVVQSRTHVRVGVGINLDLLLSITPTFFTRVGINAKSGYDTGGPFFVGAGVSLGAGLFL
jgi:hypothetical protein